MGEPIALEGRLRWAGSYDGYDIYLDKATLTEVLCEAMPGSERDEEVADVRNYPSEGDVEPWTPIPDRDEQLRRNMNEGPYVFMTTLGADWGRVRITIERLEEGE